MTHLVLRNEVLVITEYQKIFKQARKISNKQASKTPKIKRKNIDNKYIIKGNIFKPSITITSSL